MKRKLPNLTNITFGVFVVLLIIPQTRTAIQVGVNKVKLLVWSPTTLDEEDQTQIKPFSYQVTDLNGTKKSIAIGQGKISFISYWATWCPPCIAEMSSIQELHASYGDQIDFLLITNEEAEVVRRFIEKKAFDLPVYRPQMDPPEVLYENSLPTNYLIDGTGKIIIKEIGAADWNSKKVRAVIDGLLSQG